MKATLKKIATAVLAIALSSTQLLANTTDVHVNELTEADWKAIEDTAALDAMLTFEEFPAIFVQAIQVLTTKEWKAIEQQAELESMLDTEALNNSAQPVPKVLSHSEWKEIEDQAELDSMLDF